MKFNLKTILESAPLTEQKHIISNINEYLYTNYEGIGTTYALGSEYEYFSDFHKFWEKNHKKILNPKIDEKKCEMVADVLHEIYLKYGKKPFTELYDTLDLTKEEICKVRLFTANQDFRGSRKFSDFAKIYKDDPSIFDIDFIYEEPHKFLAQLGLGKLSQTDKRSKYAKTVAEFLKKNNLEPFDLFEFANKDYLKLRNILTSLQGSGFGNKKTDMFLRDMKQLDVWSSGANFDKIDVASDVNTLKVALRTGILKTDIILISSFLDIFCYQYELMDRINAKAWRTVWEKWKDKYPHETIESPCLMDYLIYKVIGKQLCNENLCFFQCKEVKRHRFYWHSSRNHTCQICYREKKIRNHAILVFKDLPCKFEEGKIYVQRNSTIQNTLPGIERCPFLEICMPRSSNFYKLKPPKSISILGRTGWTTAYTRKNEGGGGLMA